MVPTRSPSSAPSPRPPQAGGRFGVVRGVIRKAWKLGVYGPEGVGKSSLMASCPGIVVADLENSTEDLDVARVTGVSSWTDLRAWVQSVRSGIIGIDSMTRAEDWCAQWVIENKQDKDKSAKADSIEDFAYRRGAQFLCDEFRRFLADIEAAYMRGVSVVMVAHSRVSKIKNPDGTDFVRTEPRLFDDPTKCSNMLQWVQFLDHLAYLDLDKDVSKQGKAEGKGARTMYFNTAPNRMAKHRSLPVGPEGLVYPKGDMTLWQWLGVVA